MAYGPGEVSDFQIALLLEGRWERLEIDDYILVDRIGQGRLAGVYETRQRVAVKILPPSKVGDSQTFGRFQRETRLALELKHPHIVRTFQSGEANGLHYLVMEYLDDLLKRRGHLPAQEAVRLVRQALLGLQHLHELPSLVAGAGRARGDCGPGCNVGGRGREGGHSPADVERVLGLTIQEWTLMGVEPTAFVVLAAACFIGFRALRG